MRNRLPIFQHHHSGRIAAVSALLAALLTGCSQRTVTAPNPIDIDRVEFTRMYNAAVQTLRDYGFRIDRRSHRFGVITTKYLGSPTAFEPWQRANSTNDQAWESTFNDQRRFATVTLEPLNDQAPTHNKPTVSEHAGPAAYRLRVEVFVERSQHPDRRLTGSTNGHNIFGTLRSMPTELRKRGIESSYWRPLGRDTYLEQRLLAEIVRRSLGADWVKNNTIRPTP